MLLTNISGRSGFAQAMSARSGIRYQKFQGTDLWPKGKIGGFPAEAPYTYGTTTCLPVAASGITRQPERKKVGAPRPRRFDFPA
ncbi:MAG: hypothetical protein ACT443_00885 [Gemmatimonadota bacterium]